MSPAPSQLPIVGSWKLTKCVAERPELPHPESAISSFTMQGDNLHYTNEGTWSDGRASNVTVVVRLDGGWYPLTGSPFVDSVSMSLEGDHTLRGKMQKDGMDAGTVTVTISSDGQTMTGHWEMIVPAGPTIRFETTQERA